MIRVEMTWIEIWAAMQIGLMRAMKHMQARTENRNGDHGQLGIDNDVLGAIGEAALAKWKNRFWLGGRVGDIDVDSCYEARACCRPQHSMMLHPWDKDELPYVNALVLRHELPCVTLRGWVYGAEGKQPEFWRDDVPRPAFFVPAGTLWSMSQLP